MFLVSSGNQVITQIGLNAINASVVQALQEKLVAIKEAIQDTHPEVDLRLTLYREDFSHASNYVLDVRTCYPKGGPTHANQPHYIRLLRDENGKIIQVE